MILLNNEGIYLKMTKVPDAEISKVSMLNTDIAEMAYIFRQ